MLETVGKLINYSRSIAKSPSIIMGFLTIVAVAIIVTNLYDSKDCVKELRDEKIKRIEDKAHWQRDSFSLIIKHNEEMKKAYDYINLQNSIFKKKIND